VLNSPEVGNQETMKNVGNALYKFCSCSLFTVFVLPSSSLSIVVSSHLAFGDPAFFDGFVHVLSLPRNFLRFPRSRTGKFVENVQGTRKLANSPYMEFSATRLKFLHIRAVYSDIYCNYLLFLIYYLGLGVKLNTHLHLVPRSSICGAIPPFPHVFMA
jgi:hypothetical protein